MFNIIDNLTKDQLVLRKEYKTCKEYYDREVKTDNRIKNLGLSENGFKDLQLILVNYSTETVDNLINTSNSKIINNTKVLDILEHIGYISLSHNFDKLFPYFANYMKQTYDNTSSLIKTLSDNLLHELDSEQEFKPDNWIKCRNFDEVSNLVYTHIVLTHLMNMYYIHSANRLIETCEKDVKFNYFLIIVSTVILYSFGLFIHFSLI